MILKNGYVRATLVTLTLTILAGLLSANIKGPLWYLALSGAFIGTFLVVIFFIASIFSVIKDSRQQPIKLGPVSKSANYKKGLVWSLVLSAPGVLIWLSAAITTQNGGGEAYILFIPLFFLTFISLFAAVLYGIAYLYQRRKEPT